MRLWYKEPRYLFASDYAEKDIPKQAGFKWDATERVWWTADPDLAVTLVQYADARTRTRLEALGREREQTRSLSRAQDSSLILEAPGGLDYLPFQKAGIEFAGNRPATLLADEMGLGKTIQVIGLCMQDRSIRRVLVVCPASLKLNWAREFQRWTVRTLSIRLYSAKSYEDVQMQCSHIFDPEHEFLDVSIINYDIVSRYLNVLTEKPWDLFVMDEAHYCKNPNALRTAYLLGGTVLEKQQKPVYQEREIICQPIPATRRMFLTGTPICNRPKELWTLVHALAPETFGDWWTYAKRYCDAKRGSYGWDFSGASNLDELQNKLRSTVMIRRKKMDVLSELPPKRRQVVEVAVNGESKAVQAEQKAWTEQQARLIGLRAAVELAKAQADEDYEEAVNQLRAGATEAFTAIAKVRHDTALVKVPFVLQHIHLAIDEDPAYKLVLFAHHHDVVAKFRDDLHERAVVLTGETPQAKRDQAITEFQTGIPQVFIGSITAAGLGITLTAASHVVFAELDWVPGTMCQAEDRLHRIGQTNAVLVQHLVLDGSLDAIVAKRLVAKLDLIDLALDRETDLLRMPVFPELETAEASTKRLTRKQVELEKERMTGAMKAVIIAGLQHLDRMTEEPSNPIDAAILKNLLRRANVLTRKDAVLGRMIVAKYHAAVPFSVLRAMQG